MRQISWVIGSSLTYGLLHVIPPSLSLAPLSCSCYSAIKVQKNITKQQIKQRDDMASDKVFKARMQGLVVLAFLFDMSHLFCFEQRLSWTMYHLFKCLKQCILVLIWLWIMTLLCQVQRQNGVTLLVSQNLSDGIKVDGWVKNSCDVDRETVICFSLSVNADFISQLPGCALPEPEPNSSTFMIVFCFENWWPHIHTCEIMTL